MSDIDAIREHHTLVEYEDGWKQCEWDSKEWPCDTRIVLDALDAVTDEYESAVASIAYVRRERDAARADADRLAGVGEAVLAQAEHFTTGKLWDYELDRLRAALAAHDANSRTPRSTPAVIDPLITAQKTNCVDVDEDRQPQKTQRMSTESDAPRNNGQGGTLMGAHEDKLAVGYRAKDAAQRRHTDLDGKPFCPTGYAQRYHVIRECSCPPSCPDPDAHALAAAVERLPSEITRWLMGEGMVVLHRWMTTGWRDTMYDEGVAIWTADITAALDLNKAASEDAISKPQAADVS